MSEAIGTLRRVGQVIVFDVIGDPHIKDGMEVFTSPPAPVADDEHPPCDYCGVVPDYHPWHGAGFINGIESPHIHACNECRNKLPAMVVAALTDDQILEAMREHIYAADGGYVFDTAKPDLIAAGRALLAKVKELNQ